jgi:hypothetical protein
MPTVAIFQDGTKICQYYNDHDPPHFHVESPKADALIRIADFGLEKGTISNSDHAMVRRWASQHQAELALNWILADAGMAISKIGYP